MTSTGDSDRASADAGDAVNTSTGRPAPVAALAAAIEVVLAPLCDSTTTSGRVVMAGSSAAKSSGSQTTTGPRRAATKRGRATVSALKDEPEPTSTMPSNAPGAQDCAKARVARWHRSSACGCSRMKSGMAMAVSP